MLPTPCPAPQMSRQTLRLALPPEWQEAVIRAAITLKLCTYEPTGAIVAVCLIAVAIIACAIWLPEQQDRRGPWL